MPLLTFILWLALGAAQQTASGSVEGSVLRAGTTDPIENVQVTLLGGSTGRPAVFTNKEGHFSFPNVAPGRYTVRIQRDGYLISSANIPVTTLEVANAALAGSWLSGFAAGQAAGGGPTVGVVNVAAGQRVTGLNYFLIHGGTISGRILDPLGRPAASADIIAFRLNYAGGQPALSPVKTVSSNDRGEYRMFWLEPGEYYIRAEKTLPAGPARAYYPSVDSSSRAFKVQVSEGTESPKIDIRIQPVVSFKISGTVTNLVAGLSAAAAQFYLFPAESDAILDGAINVSNALTSAEDRAAGKFEIRNVQPGRFYLAALITDRTSTPPRTFMGRAEVNVPFQDTADVAVVVGPGVDLPGRLTGPANSPLPAAPQVALRPKGLFQNLPFAAALSAVPAEDGTFTIFNVPDLEYSVAVVPLAANTYIADIRQNSFSIFDIGTIGVGGRSGRSFEIVLEAPGATIKGKVPATAQQLVAGVAVVLLPDERRRQNLVLFKRQTVSESGTFSFAGVAPGRYKLLAVESIPLGAEENFEFMDKYRDDGMEITVVPGDTYDVELRLIPK